MGNSCSECGTKAVRHIEVGSMDLMMSPVSGETDSLALPFDWNFTEGYTPPSISYWMGGEWKVIPHERKRFWLPFEDQSYEDALALYTLWVEDAQKSGEQLVIYSQDQGCMRGADSDPWNGYLQLAAFRGPILDFIETGKDTDLRWLELVYRWIAEPKTKFTIPYRPNSSV